MNIKHNYADGFDGFKTNRMVFMGGGAESGDFEAPPAPDTSDVGFTGTDMDDLEAALDAAKGQVDELEARMEEGADAADADAAGPKGKVILGDVYVNGELVEDSGPTNPQSAKILSDATDAIENASGVDVDGDGKIAGKTPDEIADKSEEIVADANATLEQAFGVDLDGDGKIAGADKPATDKPA